MPKHVVRGSTAALGLWLGVVASAPATQLQATIAGSLGASENTCNHAVFVLSGAGCAYGNDRPGINGWAGPTFVGAHYAIGSAGDSIVQLPAAGDGKVAPGLSGTLTFDDANTPGVGGDDTISGVFDIDATARYVFTGNGRWAIEHWTSMSHTLAATAVSAATANAQGGFDYVIGLQGFPAPICSFINTADCFASENVPGGVPTPGSFWAGYEPNGIGIERNAIQGGNVGASTTATFQGYSCIENVSGQCATSTVVWGAGEDPGFDNLLLRIVTNSTGDIVSANGYWTQEFRIAVQETLAGDNSWIGGTLSFTGQVVPLPAAVWMFGSALGLLGWIRTKRF